MYEEIVVPVRCTVLHIYLHREKQYDFVLTIYYFVNRVCKVF